MSTRLRVVASVMTVCLLALVSTFGVTSGEKIKSKGVITNRAGDILTVKTADGPYTVILTTDTKVQQPVGLIGARKKQMPPDVLIPGLRMQFEGVGDDQGQVQAKSITFDSDDLALAEVIQAGLNPTAQRVTKSEQDIAANQREIEANRQMIAANQQNIDEVARTTQARFANLTEWDAKSEATVHFDVGSSVLSAEHKQEIAALAQEAAALKGFVIEVKGFADSTGRAADNQNLSKERAQAVVAYLLQECGIPVKNIVAPGAMSEAHPVASNETMSGRAENRRVTLRILVNKGVGTGSGN